MPYRLAKVSAKLGIFYFILKSVIQTREKDEFTKKCRTLGLEGTLGSTWLMYIFYREIKEAKLPKITQLGLNLTSQLQPLIVLLED